jgi:hypothetical protein
MQSHAIAEVHAMKLTRLLLIALSALLLVSCSSNHYSSAFSGLSGNKVFVVQATAGQTLQVEYTAAVTQGSLELQVISPQREALWTVKGDTKGQQTKNLPLKVAGSYTLQVHAAAANGTYDLQYAVK